MAFSLSPSVQVREFDLSQNVPNLPSSKTGMVLRADTGPMFKIVSITNESELVSTFGKPTSENYQDWFQAWNFLQYASSLYIVRAGKANKTTKNAGCGLSGTTVDNTDAVTNWANFYNKDIAESSLANFTGHAQKLYLINKNVTSVQDLAFGICSSKKNYTNQIGNEYMSIVASAASGGNTNVLASGRPTLTKGSKVILNGDKLVEVKSIVQGATTAIIDFDRAVSATDVAPFYATASATASAQLVINVNKAGNTFTRGAVVTQGATTFYVEAIASNAVNPATQDITFVKFGGGGQAGLTVAIGDVITGTTTYYFGNTAFNSATNDYGVAAGATEIELQAGFVMDAGVQFTIAGDNATTATLTVASVDNVARKIKLSKAVSASIQASGAEALIITGGSPVAVPQIIVGVNNLNLVYDESLIIKTRKTVNGATGQTTVVAEKLVSFDRLVEFEPTWTKDEFLVVCLKKNADGKFEQYGTPQVVSYIKGGRDSNGRNNFVEEVFFNNAKLPVYAKVGDVTMTSVDTANTSLAKITGNATPGTSDTVYPIVATGTYTATYNGFGYTQADIIAAQDLFADPESFDINRLISHELDMNGMSTIANNRKDCRAIVAPYDYGYLTTAANSDATTFMLERFGTQTPYTNKTFSEFNTYATIYGNMKYQYDKFNDVNRWICVAGDVCGLFAQTNANRDPWWATAGTSRGVMKNVIKLAFNPNKQNRDDLYVNAINPIINLPGEGNGVLMGQKTATAVASAFDRNNVRDLMIFLEKAIATAARTGLFEFNDAFTRQRLFSMIEPFLRTVKAKRGLYDYKLIIDSSNNNAEVIDANGLVIDIYLKPTKVAEFIQINAVVVKTGVSFTEVVGKF